MELQDISRITEDRTEWKRIIHSAVNPWLVEDKTRLEKMYSYSYDILLQYNNYKQAYILNMDNKVPLYLEK